MAKGKKTEKQVPKDISVSIICTFKAHDLRAKLF